MVYRLRLFKTVDYILIMNKILFNNIINYVKMYRGVKKWYIISLIRNNKL